MKTLVLLLPIFCVVVSLNGLGQAKKTPGSPNTQTQPSPSDTSANTPDSTGGKSGGGSSIEAEIIAYKSLESDSEAIACDVAGYLLKAKSFTLAGQNKLKKGKYDPQKTPCTLKYEQKNPGPEILVTSDTVFADFEQWQAAMAMMKLLDDQASSIKPCISGFDWQKYSAYTQSITSTGTSSTGIPQLDAAQAAWSFAKDIMSSFAVTETYTAVSGTIQDQALSNAVARQLRAFSSITVLTPGTYVPNLFAEIDSAKSPFLREEVRLISARDRLARLALTETAALDKLSKLLKQDDTLKPGTAGKLAPDQRKTIEGQVACLQDRPTELKAIIAAIQAFLLGLSAQQNTSQQTDSTGGSKGAPQVTSNLPQITHIMSADRVAQALGIGSDTPAVQHGFHILTLKALESGGSIFTSGNLFTGKRIYFSGGAVATYALFEPGGELACSGNVYDYGGHIKENKFRREFRKANINPDLQLLFYRGGCTRPSEDTQSRSLDLSPEKVDINAANEITIGALLLNSKIDSRYVKNIICGRPYKAIDELVKRNILPQDVYAAIKDKVVAGESLSLDEGIDCEKPEQPLPK